MVRALAFHQCEPGSIPGVDVICGLSLLLVLVLAPDWLKESRQTDFWFLSLYWECSFLRFKFVGISVNRNKVADSG